jgi:hypothetical protein
MPPRDCSRQVEKGEGGRESNSRTDGGMISFVVRTLLNKIIDMIDKI